MEQRNETMSIGQARGHSETSGEQLRRMCKNGFADRKKAEIAKAALELLNHRPDMMSYIIVQETDAKS